MNTNSEKVIFYYNPMSRGRITHWMLEEVGADYEIKFIDWQKRDQKSPEFLKISPMGKIPAIIHRGVVVTEAAAICAYLADAFPKANLAPKLDDPRRGTYLRWLFFAASNIEPAVADRNSPRTHPIPSGALGYGSYDDTMNALDVAIKDGFVLGDWFTAADVYLGASLGWMLQQKFIEPRQSFIDYVARCEAREPFKRFIAKAGALK